MAKRKNDWTSMFFDLGLGAVTSGLKHIQEQVSALIEETQKNVSEFLTRLVKSSILIFMLFFGAIFLLIGLSQYLGDVFSSYGSGMGYIVVGLVLMVLGLIVKALK